MNSYELQKNRFISGTTPIKVLRSFIGHVYRLFILFLTNFHQQRFIIITPPVFRAQLLFDKKTRTFFTINIRDYVDYGTMLEIFVDELLLLEKLTRISDIKNHYDDIIKSGKKPLIIDCGANIGLVSLYLSMFFKEAQIIAIEPDNSNATQARLNNSNNPNFVLLEAAVGCEPGNGEIFDPSGLDANAYRVNRTNSGGLTIVSINDLLDEYPATIYTPFVNKIDIEGFEADLFSQNTEWVEKFPLISIELHDWLLKKTANSHNFLTVISQLNRDLVLAGGNVSSNVYSISNTLI